MSEQHTPTAANVSPVLNMSTRFLRYLEGDGTETAGSGAGAAVAAPVVTAPVVEPVATPAAPAADDIASLPEWAQQKIAALNRENASDRVTAKTKAADDARTELLQKLGLTKDGEKPADPAALATELATAREQARTNAVNLAIYKAAGANGADPSRLLDSNSFMTSIQGLDPADGDAVSTAIKTAVAANKALKAAQAVGASGIELSGGTGETGQITEAQLARMTPEQIVEAQGKGLLKNLLG